MAIKENGKIDAKVSPQTILSKGKTLLVIGEYNLAPSKILLGAFFALTAFFVLIYLFSYAKKILLMLAISCAVTPIESIKFSTF